jgi:copper resistance protein B
VDASLFLGEAGQLGARLDAEYEYLFTQRLILSPEIELNLHRRDDEAVGIGAGLSDLSLGLRLRYEIRREFAPYIGVNWSKRFGQSADFAREDGEDVSDTQLVAGIRAWF